MIPRDYITLAFEDERRRLLALPRFVLVRMAQSDDPAVRVHLRRHLGENWDAEA